MSLSIILYLPNLIFQAIYNKYKWFISLFKKKRQPVVIAESKSGQKSIIMINPEDETELYSSLSSMKMDSLPKDKPILDLEEYNRDSLVTHNELRALHNAIPLIYDNDLAQQAQKMAEHMVKTNKFNHSDTKGKYGENIAYSSNKRSGERITLQWYAEVFDYKFDQEKQDYEKIGHFSQIVWKESTHVGFGRAQIPRGRWYYAAHYKPAGNVLYEFRANVEIYNKDWNTVPLIIKMNEAEKEAALNKQLKKEGKKLVKRTTKVKIKNGVEEIETSEVFIDDKGNRRTEVSVSSRSLTE